MARTVRRSFLPISRFWGKIVVDVQRHDREGLLAIARLSTESSFGDDTLHHPSRFSFSYLVLIASPGVVEVQ